MRQLIALAFAIAVTGCTSAPLLTSPQADKLITNSAPVLNTQASNPQAGSYPPEAITAFMQGCTAGQPQEMEKTCSCIIQQIQNRYTYTQYQAIAQANLSTAPEVQNIISSCSDNTSALTIQSSPQTITQGNSAGTYIVGQDGAFLGVVSNDRVAEKSICNQVGSYGSQVTQMSIRNGVGNYGSQISDLSAYNSNAQKPPIVIQNGKVVGILTKNRRIKGSVDPDVFLQNVCGQ
ncbi:MAG TPA: hypothetical protein V6D14_20305 [Coleofasciculaceae cyanobacterium]|jgi:hypothetical protein